MNGVHVVEQVYCNCGSTNCNKVIVILFVLVCHNFRSSVSAVVTFKELCNVFMAL